MAHFQSHRQAAARGPALMQRFLRQEQEAHLGFILSAQLEAHGRAKRSA